jgi:hypothetical protein
MTPASLDARAPESCPAKKGAYACDQAVGHPGDHTSWDEWEHWSSEPLLAETQPEVTK